MQELVKLFMKRVTEMGSWYLVEIFLVAEGAWGAGQPVKACVVGAIVALGTIMVARRRIPGSHILRHTIVAATTYATLFSRRLLKYSGCNTSYTS